MHSHTHNHHDDHGTKNIKVAFFLNLLFSVIELIGGIYTNSVAILSDAVHDFGDSVSLGLSWFLQKKSNQKRDAFYSYGYKRFSLLGAIFISVVLIFSSYFIITESIKRLMEPQATNAEGMVLLALLGILVNGVAAYRLKKGKTLNEKAVSIHLLEDVFGWIAVLIAGIVMQFVDLPIIDPILSLAITLWVLMNIYKNLRSTFKVLLQEVPQNVNVESMLQRIRSLPDVEGLHDFHLWSLDGEKNIMTLHIVTSGNTGNIDLLKLKKTIRDLALSYGVEHVTLEFENQSESDDCMFLDDC